MNNGLKVMVVDDHEMVRLGLRLILEEKAKIRVIAEAASAKEALQFMDSCQPDVVLLDVRLQDMDGVSCCKIMRQHYPQTKVIMLTSFSDSQALFESILAGASGYLLKHICSEELISSIHKVVNGDSILDPEITGVVLERLKSTWKGQGTSSVELSLQERKILCLIAQGKTNKDIASEIYLSHTTVKNYVSSILEKLNLSNRAEAAAWAIKNKIEIL